jgi:acyl-coenzyme A diphosphatase NUDT19, mitochondrial
MADRHVFPGGVVDPADLSQPWQTIVRSQLGQTTLAEQETSAHRVCAIRETFEEAGLLLAAPNASSRSTHSSRLDEYKLPLSATEIQQTRKAIHSDGAQFHTLCAKFNIVPQLGALESWARWITPVQEKRRCT